MSNLRQGIVSLLGLQPALAETERVAVDGGFEEALPVLPEPLARPAVPGNLEAANGPAVLRAIARAVDLAEAGRAA